MGSDYRDLEVRIASVTLKVHAASHLADSLLLAERRIARRVEAQRAKSNLTSDAEVLALLLLRAEMTHMQQEGQLAQMREAQAVVEELVSHIEQSM